MNDYADRKFDGHVKRTANRPLQRRGNGERARAVCSAGTDFILLVLTLNTMTILLSIAALALAWSVPVYEAVYPSTTSGAGRGVWLVDSMALPL